MTTSSIVLLILTGLCWLLLLVGLAGVVGNDAHGDQTMGKGLSAVLAIACACLIWLCLAGLLMVAGSQDILVGWPRIAALILHPASCAAALAAFYLVDNPQTRWPALIPALLPPLLAVYVFSLYHPNWIPAISSGRIVWGAVLVLSIAPWPAVAARMWQRTAGRKESVQARVEFDAAEHERKKAENVVRLGQMTPDMPLPDWYGLLETGSGVRAEAIAALRQVPRRQDDVTEGLAYGILRIMELVPELDLQPTPELCEACRAFLLKETKSLRRRSDPAPAPYSAKDWTLDRILPGLRWFAANHCDLNKELEILDNAVRLHPDSPDRQKLLAALAELRPAR